MNKRGIALILAFIVIMVLTILGAAIISRSISESRLTQRQVEFTQAFWLAEAGVNKALEELRDNYNLASLAGTALGAGGYSAAIVNNPDNSRTVTARGFIPFAAPFRAERILEATMQKYTIVPEDFYGDAIYSGGNIVLNGSSYDVDGNVTYGGTISGNTGNINGTITPDSSISPLAHLDFDQLRAISQGQGNYHDAAHLNGPFPASFWYNETQSIPNVVFLEGSLDLSGHSSVGGFFVVGGEVVYNATISGNVAVDGSIYTLGRFTINGGGGALNINGGVWAGQQVTLNGNAKIDYNSTYMSAIDDSLDIDTDVQATAWRDTQNPYQLTP